MATRHVHDTLNTSDADEWGDGDPVREADAEAADAWRKARPIVLVEAYVPGATWDEVMAYATGETYGREQCRRYGFAEAMVELRKARTALAEADAVTRARLAGLCDAVLRRAQRAMQR